MIILILLGVLAIILAWHFVDGFAWGDWEVVEYFLLLCMVALFGLLAVALTAVISMAVPDNHTYLNKEVEISALGDNGEMSGSFFLGSGTIEGERIYAYIEEQDDGGKVQKTIPAEDSTIYEVTNDNTYIEEFSTEKTGIRSWFFMSKSDESYKVYIPEESVTTDFNVDLK